MKKSKSSHHPDSPLSAFYWMIGSSVGFATMSLFVKGLMHQKFPHFEVVFFRCFINCVLVAIYLIKTKETLFPKQTKTLLVRGVSGFIAASCMFYSLGYLPLPIANLLSNCAPVFVILFSWIFLKEKLGLVAFLSVGVVFGGLILLLLPRSDAPLPLMAVFVALVGSAFAAAAYVAVRAATAKVSPALIVFYFVTTGSLLALPLALPTWQWPTPTQMFQLLALGLSASFAQIAMTQAYRFAAAGIVSSMGLLNVVISAFYGWLIFDERLLTLQWIGILILGVGMIGLTRGAKSTRIAQNPIS